MKILTMYLPQFHQVKENDEWWGEGYTDWLSAKNAKELFDNHYQPHIPLNNNYYDLTDKETLVWQSELMKKYGIDGQCIYHYWFKDGKKILEKPAEILLDAKEINMPFCFCWANQSWANSWSAIKGANIWCKDREINEKNAGNNGLLLEQQYGDKADWEEHFNYLLPFFKDDRYIKENGKPVFVLYQTDLIDVLPEMGSYWNKLAFENGLPGIYFIGANCSSKSVVDEELYVAPKTGLFGNINGNNSYSQLHLFEYENVWNHIIYNALVNKNGSYGAFVGYDDSPRRGEQGYVIKNATPSVFGSNLAKIIAINKFYDKSFTFINAWNEWGEGMHLEPDKKWGFSYLEEVPKAIKNSDSIDVVKMRSEYVSMDIVAEAQKCIERHKSYWRVFDKWMTVCENGKSIEDILLSRGMNSIAIYGLGMLGKHLVNQLKNSTINVICGIDRKDELSNYYEIPVYKINTSENIVKHYDVVIAVSYGVDEIREELRKNGWTGNIYLLEELLS